MRLLTVAFVSSAEFLSHYRERDDVRSLFYRSRTELEQNEAVLMEISFPGLPNRALVRGTVASVRGHKGSWLRCSEQDSSTVEFLLQLARGEIAVTPTVNRSFPRFPAELPVDCTVQLTEPDDENIERIVSRTSDLGAGGTFIQSMAPPPIGTRVKLSIGPAPDQSFESVTLEGHVAWIRDDLEHGFGVRFTHKSELDARMLRAMLRRASESGKVAFAN